MPKRKTITHDLRRQIISLQAQLKVERTTVGAQNAEIVAVRQEMTDLRAGYAKEKEANEKRWTEVFDKRQKIAESALEAEKRMKKRLESLVVHATLALQACERGRKALKKTKALGQARVMLEAGLEEEAKLAKEGAWASMPWLASALMGLIGGAAYLMGATGAMKTKKTAEVKA